MSNKTIRVWVRLTPETKTRLDEYVQKVPGGQSDVIRVALERYLDDEESYVRYKEARAENGRT